MISDELEQAIKKTLSRRGIKVTKRTTANPYGVRVRGDTVRVDQLLPTSTVLLTLAVAAILEEAGFALDLQYESQMRVVGRRDRTQESFATPIADALDAALTKLRRMGR